MHLLAETSRVPRGIPEEQLLRGADCLWRGDCAVSCRHFALPGTLETEIWHHTRRERLTNLTRTQTRARHWDTRQGKGAAAEGRDAAHATGGSYVLAVLQPLACFEQRGAYTACLNVNTHA